MAEGYLKIVMLLLSGVLGWNTAVL
jgi:hypothetical protein